MFSEKNRKTMWLENLAIKLKVPTGIENLEIPRIISEPSVRRIRTNLNVVFSFFDSYINE